MTCCAPAIVPFVDVDTVTINYSAQMLQDFGPRPEVQVSIQDTDTGEFITAPHFFVRKALTGFPETTEIIITLGGLSTGVIRVQ